MKLIVGLGNLGTKYEKTRHNIGFMTLDALASKEWKTNKKLKSEISHLSFAILTKPQTFMNKSGIAVSALSHFYRVEPSQIIVVHDDLDLPFGKIRIQRGGTSAGHKGISSIIDFLRTDDFVRVRVGIGRPKEGQNPEEFVLLPFSKEEQKELPKIIEHASLTIREILEVGFSAAQNKFN